MLSPKELKKKATKIHPNKCLGLDDFTNEFYQAFKEEIHSKSIQTLPEEKRRRNASQLFP